MRPHRHRLRRSAAIISGSGGLAALVIWLVGQRNGQAVPTAPLVGGSALVMVLVTVVRATVPPGGLARLAAQLVGVLSRHERLKMLRAMRRKFEHVVSQTDDPEEWKKLLDQTKELGHDLERDLGESAEETAAHDDDINPTNGTTDVPQ